MKSPSDTLTAVYPIANHAQRRQKNGQNLMFQTLVISQIFGVGKKIKKL